MLNLSDPTTHHGIVSRLREWTILAFALHEAPSTLSGHFGTNMPSTLRTYLLETLPSTYLSHNSPLLKHFSQLCTEPLIRNWLENFEEKTTYNFTFTPNSTPDNTKTSLPYSYLSGSIPSNSPLITLPAATITSPSFTTTTILLSPPASSLPCFHITTTTTHTPSNTHVYFPQNGVFEHPFLTPPNSETYQLCLQYEHHFQSQQLQPSPLLCLLFATSRLNEYGNNQIPLDLVATEIAQHHHTVVELLTTLQATCQPLSVDVGVRVGTRIHTQKLNEPTTLAQELTLNTELYLKLPQNKGAFTLTLHNLQLALTPLDNVDHFNRTFGCDFPLRTLLTLRNPRHNTAHN